MWYIIRAVVGGAKSLRNHGLSHGDIQPRHVLIDPEGGIKLTEAPLINQYFTGYNRMAFEADYHAALSPEQLAVLANRKPDVAADYTEKDEVYSAGITALCSATNNPITEYYDYTNYTVKNAAINNSLQQMGNLGYSNELVQTIGRMLNQDPSSRATLDQIDVIANKPHDVVEQYEVAPNFPVAAKKVNVSLFTRDFTFSGLIYQEDIAVNSKPVERTVTTQRVISEPVVVQNAPVRTYTNTSQNLNTSDYVYRPSERTYTYQTRPAEVITNTAPTRVITENYAQPVTTTYLPNQSSVVRRSYAQGGDVVVRSSNFNNGTSYVQGGQTVVRTSNGVTFNPTNNGTVVRRSETRPYTTTTTVNDSNLNFRN